jgi:dTDP-glucose 4,6-dehydratase
MEKRILITGGAGFVGSNFTPQIKNDARFTFHRGDIRNIGLVLDLVSQVDIVIHFAAETHVARSIYDDRKFFETDVLGTQSVANAVLKNKERIERFIHISTSEVYGTAVTRPMSEEHPLNPMTPYAAAKAGADRLVSCERIDRVLHAEDDKVRGEVFNLGSGLDLDILAIAKMILNMVGKPESLITFMADRPGQVQHHISSTVKAEMILGVKPGRNFEEGLEQTVKWYADNQKWWEKQLPMRRVEIFTKNGNAEYY